MSKIDEAVIQLLKLIEARKAADNISPANVLRRDINVTIDGALNNLYRAGRIKVGPTINDKYLTILDDGKEEESTAD